MGTKKPNVTIDTVVKNGERDSIDKQDINKQNVMDDITTNNEIIYKNYYNIYLIRCYPIFNLLFYI